ncbi:MAG: flagellar biosynthetic protein FliR [Bdellovibrionota bacterium]
MSLFNFDLEEMLTFFAVLVRYSVLMSVLPFVGDRFVPVPVKVLLSLVISIALFPALIKTGQIHPGDAIIWGRTTSGIAGTIALEVLTALALGFTARFAFDGIHFGANLVGNFMGFAAASTYDPHQESQTQVVAEIQMAIAMLIFLAMDGHHLMLRASLDSYRIVGLGKAGFNAAFSQRLVDLSSQVIRFGIQIAAPVALSIFAVNIAFGIMSKAMPQINVFVLSFAITSLVGLFVLFLGLPEFQGAAAGILGRVGEYMESVSLAMASGR